MCCFALVMPSLGDCWEVLADSITGSWLYRCAFSLALRGHKWHTTPTLWACVEGWAFYSPSPFLHDLLTRGVKYLTCIVDWSLCKTHKKGNFLPTLCMCTGKTHNIPKLHASEACQYVLKCTNENRTSRSFTWQTVEKPCIDSPELDTQQVPQGTSNRKVKMAVISQVVDPHFFKTWKKR